MSVGLAQRFAGIDRVGVGSAAGEQQGPGDFALAVAELGAQQQAIRVIGIDREGLFQCLLRFVQLAADASSCACWPQASGFCGFLATTSAISRRAVSCWPWSSCSKARSMAR